MKSYLLGCDAVYSTERVGGKCHLHVTSRRVSQTSNLENGGDMFLGNVE
jgi:hypothetical protein